MRPPPDGWSTSHPRGADAVTPPPSRGDADALGDADNGAKDGPAEAVDDDAAGCTDAPPQAVTIMNSAQQIPWAPSRKTDVTRERRASTRLPLHHHLHPRWARSLVGVHHGEAGRRFAARSAGRRRGRNRRRCRAKVIEAVTNALTDAQVKRSVVEGRESRLARGHDSGCGRPQDRLRRVLWPVAVTRNSDHPFSPWRGTRPRSLRGRGRHLAGAFGGDLACTIDPRAGSCQPDRRSGVTTRHSSRRTRGADHCADSGAHASAHGRSGSTAIRD